MIVRVAEQVRLSGALDSIVATDDQSIVDACDGFGVRAVLTRKDHQSGTDRIAEVSMMMDWPSSATVVNVQGDEPLIDPELISATAELVSDTVPMATAAHRMEQPEDIFNPNYVKQGALFFACADSLVSGWLCEGGKAFSATVRCLAAYRHLCVSQRVSEDVFIVAGFAVGTNRIAGAVAGALAWLCHCGTYRRKNS